MTNSTEARRLQAGQFYDPGYDVPDLHIGQRISGHAVIAAIRQIDCPGLLPGLHIVTAYDAGRQGAITPYVTWEVAWQPYSQDEQTRARARGQQDAPAGRWVANAGHYKASQAEALTDMAVRAGTIRAMARAAAGELAHSSEPEDKRAARRLRKWAAAG